MNLEIEVARSGDPTLRTPDGYIHSRYDPRTESIRFIKTTFTEKPTPPRTVLIVGDGLGYLTHALLDRYPSTAVAAFSLGIAWAIPAPASVAVWSPSDGSPFRWLQSRLRTTDIPGLEVVVWQPARLAGADDIDRIESGIRDAVRAVQAEFSTTALFGKLWMKNAVIHTLSHSTRREPVPTATDVTVAVSGPTLEWTAITGHPVVAASSSAQALLSRGIHPNLWVHLDGGFWASRYLSFYDTVPTALSLRSSRIHRDRTGPVLFSVRWIGEQLASDSHQWPAIPDSPTVTIAAFHLAKLCTTGAPIRLAGADFSSFGLRPHARPHPNDAYLDAHAHRTRPIELTMYERVARDAQRRETLPDGRNGWVSVSMDAYRNEFERLFPDPASSGSHAAGTGTPARLRFREITRPSFRDRAEHVRAVLRQWKELPDALDRRNRGERATEEALELALHVTPVSLMAWFRGEEPVESLRDELRTALSRLEQIAP